MSEEQKKPLETQLWNIANELRGKMDADEFRDYILGFIFYKYLSEKQYLYANKLLETETVKDYLKVTNTDGLEAIKEESLLKLGYYLKPDELFSSIAKKGNANTENQSNFILADLEKILNSIEQSTMGTESEDNFNKLFEDLDLNSTKLGRTAEARNSLISKVLFHLDKIDFALEDADANVLGDAKAAVKQGKKLAKLTRWYSPFEILKMATSTNAELLLMSGKRNPYPKGNLGKISEGAYANLIMVDGNPLGNINLWEYPENNIVLT